MRWPSRRRVRQLLLGLLALLLLLVLAAAVFVWCGGPQALLIARYQERLPGELAIGELDYPGFGRYRLERVRLADGGEELLRLGRVEVETSGLTSLHAVVVQGVDVHTEAISRGFLDLLLTALAEMGRVPGPGMKQPFALRIDGVRLLGADGAVIATGKANGRVGAGADDMTLCLEVDGGPCLEGSWRREAGLSVGRLGGALAVAGPLAWLGQRELLHVHEDLHDLLPESLGLEAVRFSQEPAGSGFDWRLTARLAPVGGALPLAGLDMDLGLAAGRVDGQVGIRWASGEKLGFSLSSAAGGEHRLQELSGTVPVRPILGLLRRQLGLGDATTLLLELGKRFMWVDPLVQLELGIFAMSGRIEFPAGGTILRTQPGGMVAGSVAMRWTGGGLKLDLHREGGRLHARGIALDDKILGRLRGDAMLDAAGGGELRWSELVPGRFLDQVAVRWPVLRELLRILPNGSGRWGRDGGGWLAKAEAVGEAGAQVTAAWEGGTLVLAGQRIPLAVAAGQLRLGSGSLQGHATQVHAEFEPGSGWLAGASLRGAGADLGVLKARGIDGELSLRLAGGGKYVLQGFSGDDLRFLLDGRGPVMEVELSAGLGWLAKRLGQEGLLAGLSGTVEVDVRREASGIGAVPLALRRLRLRGAGLPGVAEGLDLDASGALTWWCGHLAAQLDGAVSAGVLLPGRAPLDCAAGSPHFRAVADWDGTRLLLEQLLLRGADGTGSTAGITGEMRLDSAGPVGRAEVVLDPLDLGWLSGWYARQRGNDRIVLEGRAHAVLAVVLHADGRLELEESRVFAPGGRVSLFGGAIVLHGLRGDLRLPSQPLLGPSPSPETVP